MKKIIHTLLFSTLSLYSFAQSPVQPYGAVPTERQLRWQEMETYCLIHYTPTTFQNKEWGFGDADPSLFHPKNFDANQIAHAAASAGFKGLISVAKHHDGFCLWPTKTTSYNISHTPFKNGQGDMVKEFMEAARKNKMKFGIYLSAWDRHDTRYATPAYTDAYREQLTELLTGYGDIFISWHDGANGGDGYYGGLNEKRTIDRTTYYEWDSKTWPIVRKLQPEAVIFSDIGPDVRWVGNENGFAAPTSWASFTPVGLDGKKPVPGGMHYENSPEGTRHGKYWIPAECDVPQRPGWFYHADQDKDVKTPDQLFEIYLNSVGKGACMNIGLAPMPNGTLHQNDVKSLEHFGRKITNTFKNNFAKNAGVIASNTRKPSGNLYFSTHKILDNDRYSYWATSDKVHQANLIFSLPEKATFDLIQLRENIKLGQRIDSVKIAAWIDNQWKPIASATSIGANRLIALEKTVTTSKVKVDIYAPTVITLSDFGLFKIDHQPFEFEQTEGLIKTTATGLEKNLENLFDGNPATTENANEILFETIKPIHKIVVIPDKNSKKASLPNHYILYGKNQHNEWTKLTSGEFANIVANPVAQSVAFSNPEKITVFKLILTAIEEKSICSISEIEAY